MREDFYLAYQAIEVGKLLEKIEWYLHSFGFAEDAQSAKFHLIDARRTVRKLSERLAAMEVTAGGIADKEKDKSEDRNV